MARAGRNVGPAPTVPRMAAGPNLRRTEWRRALARAVGAFGSPTVQGSGSDGLRARHGADRLPRPRGLPRRGLRRPAGLGRRARVAARRGTGADGARAPRCRRAPARRDLHAAGDHLELTGEDGPKDRPFPLDLVPRIIPAEEWIPIKRGLAQRIRALNAFVDDVYHAREIIREGIVPWRLVVSRSHFARVVHGIRPPGGVYTHVAGCDLVRDADGTWKVLEDNVRTPSGISYVLENRVAMTRLVPELFAQYRVRPVDHYPQLLLAALRAVAPSADAEATVVVWTPGPFN